MNTPVIDFHSHLGRWERYGQYDEPGRYIRLMDAAGIDRSLVSCIFYGEARRNNDTVARFVSANPDRFYGVAFATPHYPAEVVPELERCFDTLGMKFLKIYPDYFGKPNDDPAYFPMYEFLDGPRVGRQGPSVVPVRSAGHDAGEEVRGAGGALPEGQVGAGARRPAAAARTPSRRLGRSRPSTWRPAAPAAPTTESRTRSTARGAERVLFGTDMPLLDARHQIAKVTTADISDEAKQRVLGLNAIELLGLDL